MAQKDTSALLIRPRFTEFHNVYIPQYELDFAIPFLNEDIPLFVDPFLLWKSPSFQDNGLRQMLIAGFNHLGVLAKQGREDEAISQVILASECEEVGLGNSATRIGRRIGRDRAAEVISLFSRIPYYRDHGFRHFEEIQSPFLKRTLSAFARDQFTSTHEWITPELIAKYQKRTFR